MTGRTRLALLTAATLAWVPVVAHGQGADLLQRLRQREGKVKDVSGHYESVQSPSGRYVASYARARKVSPESVRAGHETVSRVDFSLRLTPDLRERRFEIKTYEKNSGQKINHQLVSFDGSQTYFISSIADPQDEHVALVKLGDKHRSRFDTDCHFALLMGLCVPEHGGTLADCATSHHGVFQSKVWREGVLCARLDIEIPEKQPNPKARYAVWLDPNRGLTVVAIEREFFIPTLTRWVPSGVWSVSEHSRDDRTGEWFPRRATFALPMGEGDPAFTYELTLSELQTNRGLTPADFTPKIEEGSNVIDTKTGRSYVYGKRLSGRISGMLARRVGEAKRQVDEINAAGATRQVPRLDGGSAAWVLALLGAALVTGVAAWRLSERFRAVG